MYLISGFLLKIFQLIQTSPITPPNIPVVAPAEFADIVNGSTTDEKRFPPILLRF